MIKYNNSDIIDWNFDDSNIIKVYHNGAVCYYKITSGDTPTPTAQTPCYAVVDDITQYSETEFEDVYDKATEKWYKLNNLSQYEKYGVYGSGRTITTYEGKLTIDEAIIPPPSRLPDGYTEVEYIRNSNYNAYINTGVIPYDNTSNRFTVTARVKSEYHSDLACATIISCEEANSPYYGFGYRYKCSTQQDVLEFFGADGTVSKTSAATSDNTVTVTFTKTANSSKTMGVPLYIFAGWEDSTYTTAAKYSDSSLYSMTVVKNGETVRDFVPAKRDSDSVYGLYDLITDTFYTSPNGNSFSGGSELPSTTATCEFIYSGESWVNVGEVSGSSRVPAGYSEAEYVENQNIACINTEFKPNQDTRLVAEMQTVSTTSYVNHFGASGWNQPNAIILDYENGYNGTLHLTWGTATGWTVVSSVRGDYNKHTYDWNKNEVYRDNTLVKTFTYGNYQAVSNLYIFTTINNGSSTPSLSQYYYMKGKLYSCQIYDNGTLVRDMIPCTRDSDSKAGVYDIVNDVFYSSANSGYELVAGPTVTGGTIVYPMYYETKQDPPDNVTFTSMTEAESYECPWWGMSADIDNTEYMFCEGNEWLTKYTYIEVSDDYLCDNGNKYKKMQEYDRIPNGTTTATTTYVKGDLIESASTDCSTDYSTQYLTLVAQTDSVSFKYDTATSSNKLQYSLDNGSTWSNLSNGGSTPSVNTGDKVLFKASRLSVNTERGIGRITPSSSATVEGNIMSLEYGDNFIEQTVIQNNYQFRKLFSGVTTITSAENMVIPATTVRQQCYSQMFQGCTSLIKTPKTVGSSAMTWSGQYCFSNMFSYCTSLTTPSSTLLPALNLGTQCYWYMFEGCTALQTAPDLPAPNTASQCYQGMFKNCSSLNYIKVLSNSSFTMTEWVSGVASSGTFVKNPNATWSSCGATRYPCGWTITDYI